MLVRPGHRSLLVTNSCKIRSSMNSWGGAHNSLNKARK
jgi:hypothetical protein